jgi:hypothetical protein
MTYFLALGDCERQAQENAKQQGVGRNMEVKIDKTME